ncbi:MAG: hypothetical protein CAF45_003415 [Nitrospira sp. CG24E]|mgnify:CR=1 FL=1|nr:MAG: hypothetical protein CAF45_003415 [Nitrospira sp. CG24E]
MDSPESVVISFIAAMNGWELEASAEQRRAKAAGEEGSAGYATGKLEVLFRRHCTARACERPQGRLAAPFFQKPPEYDPANERVVAVSLTDQQAAVVETDRTAILGGGHYRYSLRNRDGRWLLDSVKYQMDDTWVQHTL